MKLNYFVLLLSVAPSGAARAARERDACSRGIGLSVVRNAVSKPVSSEMGFFYSTKVSEQNDENPHSVKLPALDRCVDGDDR